MIGIDRDPAAIEFARARLVRYGSRFTGLHGDHRDVVALLRAVDVVVVDAVLADLGDFVLSARRPLARICVLDGRTARHANGPGIERAVGRETSWRRSQAPALRDLIATWGEGGSRDAIARAIVRRALRAAGSSRRASWRASWRRWPDRRHGAFESIPQRARSRRSASRSTTRSKGCRRSSPEPCPCSAAAEGLRSSRSIPLRIARSRRRCAASLTAASVRRGCRFAAAAGRTSSVWSHRAPSFRGPPKSRSNPRARSAKLARRGEVVMNRTAPATDRGWRNSALHREADNRYARWVVKLVLGAAIALAPLAVYLRADDVLRGNELRHRRPARPRGWLIDAERRLTIEKAVTESLRLSRSARASSWARTPGRPRASLSSLKRSSGGLRRPETPPSRPAR